MDTPGYDISSVTSMVAGGATVVVFTTGRGTPTGHALAPVIKVTGNRETAKRMADNMDIDVSGILEGDLTIADAGKGILDEVIRVSALFVWKLSEIHKTEKINKKMIVLINCFHEIH